MRFFIAVFLIFTCVSADWSSEYPNCGNITVNPACTAALQGMINDVTTNIDNPSELTTNFEALSGRFLNDFGEYEACQNQNVSHYMTLNMTASISGASAAVAFGFCAPVVCSSQDLLGNASMVFDLYNYSKVFDFGLIGATPCNITVYDPTQPLLGAESSAVIVFIILGILCSFTVFGTLMNAYFDIKDSFAEKRKLDQDALLAAATQSGESPPRNQGPRKRNYKSVLKFLDCFDARKNFQRIVHVKMSESYDANLEIFNGLRVFMFMYVVYGHTYLFGTSYIDNLADIPAFAYSWWMLIIFAALYAVDAFFYMSGFFVAFLAVGKLEKMRPGVKNFFVLAFHRFYRIWPTYLFAVLFFWKVLPRLGSGPVWFQMYETTSLCDDGDWIENITFLDDFLVTSSNYCFGWGWYLSNDFQMFLITPIFLWIYIRNRTVGKLAICGLIVASWITAIFVGSWLNVSAAPPTTGGITNPRGFVDYYVKPYIRLPPYFIGVLMGLFYKEYKEKKGFSYRFGEICRGPVVKIILEWGGFALMMWQILIVRNIQFNPSNWPESLHVVFRAFQKSIYVIAMTMIILPSLLGEDTYLKRFMSHPLLIPLYRVSFTAYLVHLFWIYRYYYNLTASFHFSDETVLYNTLAGGIVSFGSAFILSLLMEVPTSNIESTYLTKKRGPRPPKPAEGNKEPLVAKPKLEVDA
jgi:peptidoglycan/LPS O-acetylase OafA/YrhL